MKRLSVILGVSAAVFSMVLWVVLVAFNPYADTGEGETVVNTFLMLVLPAVIAAVSSVMRKKLWLFAAFLWSLPLSLYLTGTPGIFAFFGLTSLCYFVSFLLMFSSDKKLLAAR